MDILNSLSLLLGGSWGSGINLYLTTAILGISHRMHWLTLPGDMSTLAHPLVIIIAIVMYAIEFVADKVPFVDSAWDAVHTFIRPFGGAMMGFLATSSAGPAIQYPVAVLTGSIALDSHLTKATTRVAINTSPEPVSNSIASVTEDAAVAGVMYFVIKHPIIAALIVILFIAFSIWFLRKMFRFMKRILLGSKNKNIKEDKVEVETKENKENKEQPLKREG